MTNDEEPIELLMPSAAMQPVLSDLRAALVRLGDVKTRSAPRVWDNIDFEGTAANIARFTLWMKASSLRATSTLQATSATASRPSLRSCRPTTSRNASA